MHASIDASSVVVPWRAMKVMVPRALPCLCRYDVLVENLLDPAHLAYAHKGLMREPPANAPDVLVSW
jgi:phenylpropionate dioxygenase-like ring-hydroxylating dioxygenase large terminal subunit